MTLDSGERVQHKSGFLKDPINQERFDLAIVEFEAVEESLFFNYLKKILDENEFDILISFKDWLVEARMGLEAKIDILESSLIDLMTKIPSKGYKDNPLTLYAQKLADGAKKYDDRNWELADSEALDGFVISAFRHLLKYFFGQNDEEHIGAIIFNMNAFNKIIYKLQNK